MHTLTTDELPEDYHRQVVIKAGERTRYQRMAVALERTLKRCSEIHAEYELKAVTLRQNCEKQGFDAGFQLFFSRLVTLIDECHRLQDQREAQFRQHVSEALGTSLRDPTIVERIVHHLQEQCGSQKVLRNIIPCAVELPDGADAANYRYTDNNHITVQNEMDAIRFPSESLCRQWLQHAEEKIAPLDAVINTLSANLLRDIAGKLIDMSHQLPEGPLINDQENNHE